MCGINGVFSFKGSEVNVEELLKVRDSMKSRGPDSSGLWVSSNKQIGFGHRRLAIIDTSEVSNQPMLDHFTGNCIAFNGEIYNWKELRQFCEKEGKVFKTNSDTEVLLHLYDIVGITRMLNLLRGMYAFALWDNKERVLYLARDPFGIKPLYYSCNNNELKFSSQVKALLRSNVDLSYEPAGHVGYFIWGSVPEPFTLYRGIRSVPAGSIIKVFEKGVSEITQVINITNVIAESAYKNVGKKQDILDELVDNIYDSVIAHTVSDVSIGIFLSAGQDSSIIASCVASSVNYPTTLTLQFKEYLDTRDDESTLAGQVAKRLKTNHSTIEINKNNFDLALERILSNMDQPSIDGINTWLVAQAAAKLNLKVALSGIGGDEIFGSYPSFRDIPKILKLNKNLHLSPALGKIIRQLIAPIRPRIISPKYMSLIEYGGDLFGAYLLRRALYLPWEVEKLLDRDLVNEGLSRLEDHLATNNNMKEFRSDTLAISALELTWYTRNQLLRDADWAGMAHSLEIRVPFLDIKLLQSVAKLLFDQPTVSKSEITAAVAPNLPREIFTRPKSGFSVPVTNWYLKSDSHSENVHGTRGWAKYVYDRFIQ